MIWDLLWLLLPVAAATGWISGRLTTRREQHQEAHGFLPGEYVKGLNYLLNEQPDKALEFFVKVVEVDSETVETYLLLGSLFRRRGEVDRAIRIHQNLIARPHLEGKHRATALLELGKDYTRAGLLDRAEGLYKELLTTKYLKAEACYGLQKIYEQERDWLEAIRSAETYQSVSGVHQNNVIAHYWCEAADQQRQAGRNRIANDYAKKAIIRDPGCVRASILMGDIALSTQDSSVAAKHYAKVADQDPDFLPVVLPKLRAAYAGIGDQKGLSKLLSRFSGQKHDNETILQLIRDLLERGEEPAARQALIEEMGRQVAPIRLLREYVALELSRFEGEAATSLALVERVLDEHLRQWFAYRCIDCGFRAKSLFWQCPSCNHWGSIRPYDSPDDNLTGGRQHG